MVSIGRNCRGEIAGANENFTRCTYRRRESRTAQEAVPEAHFKDLWSCEALDPGFRGDDGGWSIGNEQGITAVCDSRTFGVCV